MLALVLLCAFQFWEDPGQDDEQKNIEEIISTEDSH